jgi:hypothetical protein
MLYPSSHQKRLFIAEPSKTKRRKNNSMRLSFLLSFDLRDYPSINSGFSPSVPEACHLGLSRIEISYSPFA